MVEQNNATCAVCGKEYHVCQSCRNQLSFVPWRTITDTANCYKIHIILNDYTNKRITKHKAKEQLEMCDLTGMSGFLPEIKAAVESIVKEEATNEHRKTRKKDIETDNSEE